MLSECVWLCFGDMFDMLLHLVLFGETILAQRAHAWHTAIGHSLFTLITNLQLELQWSHKKNLAQPAHNQYGMLKLYTLKSSPIKMLAMKHEDALAITSVTPPSKNNIGSESISLG